MIVFNEAYANAYDSLYVEKDYRKECDFLEKIFARYNCKPKSILDLGCGTGGHALILAKRGFIVTGVDRSSHMLNRARRKAEDSGLKVDFMEGDLTNIQLNKKFDAVVSMFAVMSYQTANSALAAVCKLAKDSLNANGLFIFDCWHGPGVLTDRPTTRIKEVSNGRGERIIRFTEPELDALKHTVNVNFKVWTIKNNIVQETIEKHAMRFFFPQEITYFLEVAGFKKITCYPLFDINNALTENIWNMTVIAC